MSLREWDRKAKIIKSELATLIESYDWKDINRTDQTILSMNEQLPRVENNLARNLAFIMSQASRKGLFTLQEKAILHWASDYSKRVQSFFQDYSETFNHFFWAKIVVCRTSSVTSHGEGEFFTSSRGSRALNGPGHQLQLLSARRALKKRKEALKERDTRLEERYQNLAMIKSNRDAASNTSVDMNYLKVLPKKFSGLKTNKFNHSSNPPFSGIELSSLSTRPQTTHEKADTKVRDGLNRKLVNPIEAFDYLNLEKQLENRDH